MGKIRFIFMSVTRSGVTLGSISYCGFEIRLGRKGEMTKQQYESLKAFVKERGPPPTQDTGEPILTVEQTLEDSLEYRSMGHNFAFGSMDEDLE